MLMLLSPWTDTTAKYHKHLSESSRVSILYHLIGSFFRKDEPGGELVQITNQALKQAVTACQCGPVRDYVSSQFAGYGIGKINWGKCSTLNLGFSIVVCCLSSWKIQLENLISTVNDDWEPESLLSIRSKLPWIELCSMCSGRTYGIYQRHCGIKDAFKLQRCSCDLCGFQNGIYSFHLR